MNTENRINPSIVTTTTWHLNPRDCPENALSCIDLNARPQLSLTQVQLHFKIMLTQEVTLEFTRGRPGSGSQGTNRVISIPNHLFINPFQTIQNSFIRLLKKVFKKKDPKSCKIRLVIPLYKLNQTKTVLVKPLDAIFLATECLPVSIGIKYSWHYILFILVISYNLYHITYMIHFIWRI